MIRFGKMKKKILVFGKVAKDYIVTGFPFSDFYEKIKREETNTVGKIAEYWGGSGLNVAAASSFPCFQENVETYLFTQNAKSGDPDRDALNKLCQKFGIKLVALEESYIPKIGVLVESGKGKTRTFLSGSNGKMSLKMDKIPGTVKAKILESAENAYAVVLAGLTPDNPFASIEMRLLLNEMKKHNEKLIIALDLIASDFGEAQLSIFSSADYLLPSDAELPLLMEDAPEKDALKLELKKPVLAQDVKFFDAAATNIFERFKSLRLLGVKRGGAGSRVYRKLKGPDGKQRIWWRDSIAEQGDVKDTTGAGDAWIGAFMASEAMDSQTVDYVQAEKGDFPECANPGVSAARGNVIARLCISEVGAINWRGKIPDCGKFHELVKLVPGSQNLVK